MDAGGEEEAGREGQGTATVFPVAMYECENWTQRRQSTEELMLSKCGAGEDSSESLGLKGDQISES